MPEPSHVLSPTEMEALLRLRQAPERGSREREAIHAVLDVCPVAHVSFVCDGWPMSIPTAIARHEETLLLHGNRNSRLFRVLASGVPLTLSCCVLDGLVKARSAFKCSMNYRSVVVMGQAEEVTGEDKADLLNHMTARLIPGAEGDFRAMTHKEVNATCLLRLSLQYAQLKARSGGPKDPEEDQRLPYWAGELPLAQVRLPAVAADNLPADVSLPGYAEVPF